MSRRSMKTTPPRSRTPVDPAAEPDGLAHVGAREAAAAVGAKGGRRHRAGSWRHQSSAVAIVRRKASADGAWSSASRTVSRRTTRAIRLSTLTCIPAALSGPTSRKQESDRFAVEGIERDRLSRDPGHQAEVGHGGGLGVRDGDPESDAGGEDRLAVADGGENLGGIAAAALHQEVHQFLEHASSCRWLQRNTNPVWWQQFAQEHAGAGAVVGMGGNLMVWVRCGKQRWRSGLGRFTAAVYLCRHGPAHTGGNPRHPARPHPRPGPGAAAGLGQGRRAAGVPGAAGPAPALAAAGGELGGGHRPAQGGAHGARHRLPPAPARTDHRAGLQRRHPEVSLAPGRRRGDRVGPDPERHPADPLHLLAGRLRAGLRLLRHRPDGLPAEPLGVRDRRAGPRDRPPAPRSRSPPMSSSWAWASRCSTGPGWTPR